MKPLHPHTAYLAGKHDGALYMLALIVYLDVRPMVSRMLHRLKNATMTEDPAQIKARAEKSIRLCESLYIRKHLSLRVLDSRWITGMTNLFLCSKDLLAALDSDHI